jgi:calpain-7
MFQISGGFTSKNAGGSPGQPTFVINPQYHLRIHPENVAGSKGTGRVKKSQLQLFVQADRRTPVNVLALWSQGQRIGEHVFLYEWLPVWCSPPC